VVTDRIRDDEDRFLEADGREFHGVFHFGGIDEKRYLHLA
jgi:hypothetical protein